MALEMNSDSTVCFKCGRRYSGWKGYFHVSYALLYKGGGHLTICKTCVDKMYNEYLAQCGNAKDAVRQMCRKLDIFWSESVFEAAMQKSGAQSVMAQYIAKTNSTTYAGKSYDDTLLKEGTLWGFTSVGAPSANDNVADETKDASSAEDDVDEAILEYMKEIDGFRLTKEIVAFWGAGYSKQAYAELERRRAYWMEKLSGDDMAIDIGTETLLRQICSLEVEINKGRAAGKQMDAKVTLLNTLLGSANLKPVQKKGDVPDDLASAPLGVKIYNVEKHKPLPDGEERELKRYIKKYIWTWLGHICKLCRIKNGYTKLYDEEIERLRVKHPEYEDESDEDLIMLDLSGDEPIVVDRGDEDGG